jgi:opine dehydrogenase
MAGGGMSDKAVWAVIGGGNGGQSMAGHLALMGYRVRLFDIFKETVEAINERGGIQVEGVVEGFGALEEATTDLVDAVDGADILVIVAPATAHREIAASLSPCLRDGQAIFVHPGATGGALEVRQVLDERGCRARVAIAETNTLIYACRAPSPGHACIHGIKKDLVLATLPARENARVLAMVREAFPQTVGGRTVMETSLGNANAVMHPAPTLLNTSLIESRHEWLYYLEGITPTVGAFVEALDSERLALAAAYGITLVPILEWYAIAYGAEAPTLSEAVRRNPAYAKIKGQKQMRTRYLLEDIPTGLVPMIEFAALKGVDVERMRLVARLGELLLGEDFRATGRTLERLGVAGMNPRAFDRYLETGER